MNRFTFTDRLPTERLLLRPYVETDFEALYAMRSDVEVARYMYWEPQTADEVRRTLERKIASIGCRRELEEQRGQGL